MRGAAPADLAKYEGSGGEFVCFDGKQRIPLSQVNDDYCDCADGSDEPGTPACSGVAVHRFACGWGPLKPADNVGPGMSGAVPDPPKGYAKLMIGNAAANNGRRSGSVPVYGVTRPLRLLPLSQVDDGVCDCCDGSDEALSGAPCARHRHASPVC